MKINLMRVGMKVHHARHGTGTVKMISETALDVDFNGAIRNLSVADQELSPAEPIVSVTGLDVPLPEFIRQMVGSVLREMGVEKQEDTIEGLANRWREGTLVLQPADAGLQSKELPLETFFHKIVMMRNNLRVLEQKVNSHPGLNDGEKVELQQYVTRCYGSMTSFNILFKDKEEQF